MLAVSEECRNDVYEMIDMAMLLEKGFERDADEQAASADGGTARRVLEVRYGPWPYVISETAAVLAAAAAVAFAFDAPGILAAAGRAAHVARVSREVASYRRRCGRAACRPTSTAASLRLSSRGPRATRSGSGFPMRLRASARRRSGWISTLLRSMTRMGMP